MIRILSESIINKIAAGEVIERPSNAVKELLENSIDSGADEIKIEIFNAGIKKIKITDNGCGMKREDVILSFKRHATSKIENIDDLFNIKSLGFRGEALSSIAEISNLRISSKTKDDKLGTYLEIEGGNIIKTDSIAMNNGTTIEVKDLFYNVPARKKYLKSIETEFSHIVDIVMRYALINKNISIKLLHNNSEVINSPKTDSLLDNITSIYGYEISKDLIEVINEKSGVKVYGYISRPSLTRSERNDQSIYINNRYVKDNIISNAVYDAYKTLLFINRHPIFVLEIKIDPQDVDVNVHPTKHIVKLKNENDVYSTVFEAVKKSFSNNNLIVNAEIGGTINEYRKPVNKYNLSLDKQTILNVKEHVISSEIKPRQELVSQSLDPQINTQNKQSDLFDDFKILGQINKTFIICENSVGLAIIDQHAAEERVNYEKFMKELKEGSIKKQKLLNFKILELNPMQYLSAISNKEFLEKIGFEFEEFGKNTVKLMTIPLIFDRLKSTIFIDIINELLKEKFETIDNEIEERIIRFACRASVKAGDELTIVELKKLLSELGKADNPYSCPHGRPSIINFSIGELEKKFKRTGW